MSGEGHPDSFDPPEMDVAAQRALLYQVFSRVFATPEGDIAAGLSNGTLLEEIASFLEAFDWVPSSSGHPLPTGPWKEPQRLYTDLFETGVGPVSLQEYRHTSQERKKLWEEVLRFYDFFQLRPGERKEWPDHLVVELEFLYFLSFQESRNTAEAHAMQRAQFDFLDRHLARWVLPLRDDLRKIPNSEPYATAADLLASFVTADLTRLKG